MGVLLRLAGRGAKSAIGLLVGPVTLWPVRVVVYVMILGALTTPSIDPVTQAASGLVYLALYVIGWVLRWKDDPRGYRAVAQDYLPAKR